MSIIENKYPTLGNPIPDYQEEEVNRNGYSSYHDNNNTPRSSWYCNQNEKENARGNPTFFFWMLVVFIFVLAVGNLILTFVILGVLRLGQGMESLELMTEENMIKFYGNADLDNIYKKDGHLESFGDVPMSMEGKSSSVLFRLDYGSEVSPSMDIGVGRSVIKVDSFRVSEPNTGVPIFSTEYPNFGLPRGVQTLNIQRAVTKRVSSPVDRDLSLKSGTKVTLKGNEGTRLDGKEVVWSADQDIHLISVSKGIVLSGNSGVHIDVKRLPIVTSDGAESTNSSMKKQFKICVCMPSGKLFRVPVTGHNNASCHVGDVPASEHPCL